MIVDLGSEEEKGMKVPGGSGAMVIGGGLLLLVSGCATGEHRHSAQNICEAAGGTYSQGTCNPGPAPVSARQMCEKMNARWIEELQQCDFVGGKAK